MNSFTNAFKCARVEGKLRSWKESSVCVYAFINIKCTLLNRNKCAFGVCVVFSRFKSYNAQNGKLFIVYVLKYNVCSSEFKSLEIEINSRITKRITITGQNAYAALLVDIVFFVLWWESLHSHRKYLLQRLKCVLIITI